MSDTAVCHHGMGSVGSCVDCMAEGVYPPGKSKAKKIRGLHRGRTSEASTTAEYQTECPNCESLITPGDRIFLLSGDWVCGGCVVE